MDWTLYLILHWPHQRLALGWEMLEHTEEDPGITIKVFLGILTLRLEIYQE
jgi:hypothetical protein